jgi:hypothetical protein
VIRLDPIDELRLAESLQLTVVERLRLASQRAATLHAMARSIVDDVARRLPGEGVAQLLLAIRDRR